MNQYGKRPNQDPRRRQTLPRFDPRDNLLLRELIDKRPGLKNVNGDPKLLSALWDDLAAEYNKSAIQFRHVAILRRKFKNIRDTIKKRLKEDSRKDGDLNKRPRLDVHEQFNSFRSHPEYNRALNQLTSFPVSGLVTPLLGGNLGGLSGTSSNFRDNSYVGGPSINLSQSYDHPPQRLTFSPPPPRDNFSNSNTSLNNDQRQLNQRNYSEDEFDPFDGEQRREPFCEDDSTRERQDNGGDSGNAGPSDFDFQIADRQRTKLDIEIACIKAEHQRFMMRMRRYHDLKIQEVSESMQQLKRKHALECEYLQLKIKHVQIAISTETAGQLPEQPDDYLMFKAMQKGVERQRLDRTKQLEKEKELGRVEKKVETRGLESEMELFLETTGMKDTEDMADAELAEINAQKNTTELEL